MFKLTYSAETSMEFYVKKKKKKKKYTERMRVRGRERRGVNVRMRKCMLWDQTARRCKFFFIVPLWKLVFFFFFLNFSQKLPCCERTWAFFNASHFGLGSWINRLIVTKTGCFASHDLHIVAKCAWVHGAGDKWHSEHHGGIKYKLFDKVATAK